MNKRRAMERVVVTGMGIASPLGCSLDEFWQGLHTERSGVDGVFQGFFLQDRASPLAIPVSMNMAPSANLSIRYGFQGPLLNVDAACASASHAIAHIYNQIRTVLSNSFAFGGSNAALIVGKYEG